MCGILACGTMACCAGCSCCGSMLSFRKSTCTRVLYILFFLIISVLSYVFSYWAVSWFSDIDILKICSRDDNECYGALVVYRLTFGLAVYHILLALTLIGVKSTEDSRAQLQDGYWPVKIVVLGGIIFASFYIPNQFFVYYGWISLFGAAAFILIQLVLLIEFAYTLNESWVGKIEDEGGSTSNRYYVMLLIASIGSICLALALTITMLVLFGKTCQINQFFIVFNLALSLIIGVLSVNEKIREYRPSSGLLQSGLVMMYSTYLVYSAIMSEPVSTCSTFSNEDPKNYTVIMGAIFTIISVCYSAFRASDSNELLGRSDSPAFESLPVTSDDDDYTPKMEDDEKHGVAYSYTYFHITFALGAMYIGMLLTNWSTIGGVSTASINVDTGLVSVWVKIVSGWLVHLLYLWTLAGPVLLPNRIWD